MKTKRYLKSVFAWKPPSSLDQSQMSVMETILTVADPIVTNYSLGKKAESADVDRLIPPK